MDYEGDQGLNRRYASDSSRWAVLSSVLLARTVAGVATIAVMSYLASSLQGGTGGIGFYVAAFPITTAAGVVDVFVYSAAAGLLLRPALRLIAGLEIGIGSAVAVFLIVNAASGVVTSVLLQSTSNGVVALTGLATPLLLIGTLLIEMMVVQTVAYAPGSQRSNSGGSTAPLGILLIAAGVVVVLLGSGHKLSLGGKLSVGVPLAHKASEADSATVTQDMDDNVTHFLAGWGHGTTLRSISCQPASSKQADGLGYNPRFTYYDCLAHDSTGIERHWCAAWDGSVVGTDYDGPKGCEGPSYDVQEP